MKSVKSMQFIKKMNGGLIKLAKSLKLKPNQLYIILGIIAFLLLVLVLNLGKKKEGLMSMAEANNSNSRAMDNMGRAINSVTWNPISQKIIFTENVVNFYGKKLMYLNQGDLSMNAVDLGGRSGDTVPDGQIYKLKSQYDISGNTLPRYMDNTTATNINTAFDIKKYDITQVVQHPVYKSELDTLSAAIKSRIGLFSPYEQTTLNDAFNALSQNADDVYKFIKNTGSPVTGRDTGDGGYGESRAERMYRLSLIANNYKYNPLFQDDILRSRLNSPGERHYRDYDDDDYISGRRRPRNHYDDDLRDRPSRRREYNRVNSDAVAVVNSNGRACPYGFISNGSGCVAVNNTTDVNPNGRACPAPLILVGNSCVPSGSNTIINGGYGGDYGGLGDGSGAGSNIATTIGSSANVNSAGTGVAGTAGTGVAANVSSAGTGVAGAGTAAGTAGTGVAGAGAGTGTAAGTAANVSSANVNSAGAAANVSSASAATANPSPSSSSCAKAAPVPPCPPCERCPEPSFDCKRVPNYNSASINQYLPRPVMADFSQFGM